jgi:DNA adenine methylase
MTMQTAIKPILKYPGAKWNLAAWIIAHFPAHTHYVEPYFGSGAVFFNKTPAKHEVINDLSGDVVNLFRVIREDGERLAALIEMTPWAREEYELSYQACDDPMERARRFMVRCWQGHSAGLASKVGWAHHGVILPYTANVIKWSRVSKAVLQVTQRLRYTDIEQKPGLEVARDYSASDCLIYADPPYPLSTRSGKMYQHEMTDADHILLLDALDAHPGPVVLSGYHCALYDDRLSHWHTREKQAQAEKGNTRTEVLWLNQVCVDRLGYGPMFD